MDAAQHHELQQMLAVFKDQCLQDITETYKQAELAIDSTEALLIESVTARFSKVEEMLAGPYDRRLHWDWVPQPSSFDAGSSLLDLRVRLRDLPSFELSAQEYLSKYVKSQSELGQAISDLGFHLPPQSALFATFLKDVIEGRKLLIPKDKLRRVDIPNDQIALAFQQAEKMIAEDAILQKYVPTGRPVTLIETIYFLEAVNSVRRLHYKVISPISAEEEKMASEMRTIVTDAVKDLTQARNSQAALVKHLLEDVQSPNLYGVSSFLELYAQYHARITQGQPSR